MSQLQIDTNLLSENVLGLTYDILYDVERELEKYQQIPTKDELIAIVNNVRSQNSFDLDLTNSILYFVLQHKIDDISPTHQVSTETHDILMETIISELHFKSLPPTYKALIEGLEKSEKIMARLRVGNESEAKRNSDTRRANRTARVNTWIKRGDEVLHHDLERYLEFIKVTAEGQPLTQSNLDRFRRSLSNESNIPLAEESSMIKKVSRSSKRIAASMISDEFDQLPKVSKEQREQIHLVHDLINNFNVQRDELLKTAQQITDLEHKKQDRESRQISSVINEYIHGNIDTKQTISGVYQAIKHPFSKVLEQDKDKPIPIKVAKLGAVAVRKGGKLTKKLAKFYVKGSVGLVKDAVVHPSTLILKSSLSAINAMEAIKAGVAAQLENDPIKKEELMAEAHAKLSNLTYNSRKSLEAIILSSATALVVGATAVSCGASLPVTASVSAAITHAFYVADIMDNTKSGLDFVQSLNDLVTNSTNVEDPNLRDSLKQIRILLEQIALEEDELTAASVLRTMSRSSSTFSNDSSRSTSQESLDQSDDFGDMTVSNPVDSYKQKYNKVISELRGKAQQSTVQDEHTADDASSSNVSTGSSMKSR